MKQAMLSASQMRFFPGLGSWDRRQNNALIHDFWCGSSYLLPFSYPFEVHFIPFATLFGVFVIQYHDFTLILKCLDVMAAPSLRSHSIYSFLQKRRSKYRVLFHEWFRVGFWNHQTLLILSWALVEIPRVSMITIMEEVRDPPLDIMMPIKLEFVPKITNVSAWCITHHALHKGHA